MSFGYDSDFRNINQKFKILQEKLVSTFSLEDIVSNKNIKNNYEYYMKIIPTTYIDIVGKSYNVYQISTNEHEYESPTDIPSIYFRYDLSPISVSYKQQQRHNFHFFVNLCAIVGGVYTVVGILYSIINALLIKE